jgi:predicted hotdog family 3-hydroxylacyl-ACP dehydratase
LLNDPNQRPALATIEKIAHAVGVCVGWLLEEDDYRLTEPDGPPLISS